MGPTFDAPYPVLSPLPLLSLVKERAQEKTLLGNENSLMIQAPAVVLVFLFARLLSIALLLPFAYLLSA